MTKQTITVSPRLQLPWRQITFGVVGELLQVLRKSAITLRDALLTARTNNTLMLKLLLPSGLKSKEAPLHLFERHGLEDTYENTKDESFQAETTEDDGEVDRIIQGIGDSEPAQSNDQAINSLRDLRALESYAWRTD